MYRWNTRFRQAENYLFWAKDTLERQRYAQACSTAQHVGEKAIEALAFKLGYDVVRSHSLREIADMAKRLYLYYISARYPSNSQSSKNTRYTLWELVLFSRFKRI